MKADRRRKCLPGFLLALLIAWQGADLVHAGQNADLVADRTAIERVHYEHRLGIKQPFEKVVPPSLVARLVARDLHKEAVLRKVYHVEVTPPLIAAEVQRITTTTRAPQILAELRSALGNDPDRFARAVARPIVVDRLLRERFDNDDDLHRSQRRQIEAARDGLIAARKEGAGYAQLFATLRNGYSNAVTETAWRLEPRPAEMVSAKNPEAMKSLDPSAPVVDPPPDLNRQLYLADLPMKLQNVLRVQLRQAGDISAVIEMPDGFLLCVAREKTESVLSAAELWLPKRGYDQWIAEQSEHPL